MNCIPICIFYSLQRRISVWPIQTRSDRTLFHKGHIYKFCFDLSNILICIVSVWDIQCGHHQLYMRLLNSTTNYIPLLFQNHFKARVAENKIPVLTQYSCNHLHQIQTSKLENRKVDSFTKVEYIEFTGISYFKQLFA